MGVPLPIIVEGYRSPCVSPVGYADQLSDLQPLGWYSLTALAPSGVLHSVCRGMMAGPADMDDEAQLIQEQLRLISCRKSEVDSWAADYVGFLFQRYPDETDEFYVPRLKLMIGKPRGTLAAVRSFAEAFLNSITYGVNTPPIQTWDAMTQPTLSTIFGISAGQLVIQIGQITQFPPAQNLATSSTDYRLDLLVNYLAKAGGIMALYYLEPGIQWI